ncbi:hypothetical protein [uncultured Methanobrevibacter sp.]|uniref:hypothetical protein n=1 Tax=uncultured Methanobrevibacter sp. TaxID=253161 RepID=UPI0025F974C4|nr:hypothetical protein [uncultured Methanobrevibacter sp.]
MNKKMIEYLIITTAAILLIYGCYSIINYKYLETEKDITDSIIMYYPSSSEYHIVGDTIEFRNLAYDFYNMDVSKLNSTDGRLTNLLNHFANVNQGTIDYKNESCYLLTMEFEDNGFKYHSIIIPINSFNKDNLSFTNKTNVYLFDGNNREFVVDTAFNSQGVL